MTDETKPTNPPKKRGRPPGKTKAKKPKMSVRKELSIAGEWYKKLRDDEIGKDEATGEEFPYFRGLARLAEEAGKIFERVIKTEFFHMSTNSGYMLIAQIVVEVGFEDGTIWCGSADAHPGNCKFFKGHPTALAETRALGRAYRKALGIHKICFEEKSDDDNCVNEMTGEPSSQQLALIRNIANKIELKLIDVIAQVTTREEVTSLEDLTYKEAQEASRYVSKVRDEAAMKTKKQRKKDEGKKA